MSRVLAFDFGASTGRTILAEYENGRLSYNEVHRFDNSLVEKDGLLCWDFEYLLGEVKKAIDMCENVDSLAFDTWGVDYGMLDGDGKLISLPVCYRDERTKNAVKKVFDKLSDKELYRLTGNQIMPINTLFQLCVEKQKMQIHFYLCLTFLLIFYAVPKLRSKPLHQPRKCLTLKT